MADVVNQWTNERKRLRNFLSQRGYNIEEVQNGLVPHHFSEFVFALSEMGQILDRSELLARATKNEGLTAESLTFAKIQEDHVYSTLTLALGTPTKQVNLEGKGPMIIVDVARGGLESMDRVWKEPMLGALRDYVMQRYSEGVTKCADVLSP